MNGEMTGPPRFLGSPLHTCAALRPRWDRRTRPQRHDGAAVRFVNGVGSHGFLAYEAQSHRLCPHCLRFAGRVTATHARLASGCWPALPGGSGYPLGSNTRFQGCIFYISSSSSRLGLAHWRVKHVGADAPTAAPAPRKENLAGRVRPTPPGSAVWTRDRGSPRKSRRFRWCCRNIRSHTLPPHRS